MVTMDSNNAAFHLLQTVCQSQHCRQHCVHWNDIYQMTAFSCVYYFGSYTQYY